MSTILTILSHTPKLDRPAAHTTDTSIRWVVLDIFDSMIVAKSSRLQAVGILGEFQYNIVIVHANKHTSVSTYVHKARCPAAFP